MQPKRTPIAYLILIYLADTVLDELRGTDLALYLVVRKQQMRFEGLICCVRHDGKSKDMA